MGTDRCSSSRRRFLAGLGGAGATLASRLVAGRHRIRAGRPRSGARARSSSRALARTSIAGSSAPSWSISGGPSTPACTSPARRWPTPTASAPTWCARSRSWASRSSGIRAGISSRATTGSTAWDRRRSGRRCSSARGTRSRPTSSAPTSSSTGAGMVGTEPLLGMNFGTGTRGDGGGLRRVLQSRARHEVERAAAVARLREAAQRALLVPRQRDGRSVADRPDAGARVRPQGARRGAADARHRSRTAADRLRVERHGHAPVPDLGSRSARRVLRPGRRHLAARLLRQHAAAHRQQHGAVPGDEPRHGSPDSRGGRRLRLRAGAAAIAASASGCRSTSGTSGTGPAAATR